MKFIFKVTHYLLDWLLYFFIVIFEFIAKIFVFFNILPVFFKGVLASRAVGASMEAIEQKQYEKAFKILKPIVEYDIKDLYVCKAKYLFGWLHFNGYGIEKNIVLSEKYIKSAAECGDKNAKEYLKKKSRKQEPETNQD